MEVAELLCYALYGMEKDKHSKIAANYLALI